MNNSDNSFTVANSQPGFKKVFMYISKMFPLSEKQIALILELKCERSNALIDGDGVKVALINSKIRAIELSMFTA